MKTKAGYQKIKPALPCVICGEPAGQAAIEKYGGVVVNIAPVCSSHEAEYTLWELLAKGDNPTWGTKDGRGP